MDPEALIRGVQRQLDGCSSFFFDAFTNQNVNQISGDDVEFGSWGANTMNQAYRQMVASGRVRHMWAFDSFLGLPPATDDRDLHPGWAEGGTGQGGVDQFHLACEAHGIPRDSYTAVAGYYEDSLPPLGPDQPPTDIAVAYVDCNLYSSTVSVLRFLAPRLKHGMILAFDDYHCWSTDRLSAERSAMLEFEQANPQWHFERYHDVHRTGVSFVVEHADQCRPDPSTNPFM